MRTRLRHHTRLMILLVFVLLQGCDPIVTTVQEADFVIREKDSGRPVKATLKVGPVALFEAQNKKQTGDQKDAKPLTIAEWLDQHVQSFGGDGTGQTDSNGKGTISIALIQIVGALDNPLSDHLSGQEYFVKIEGPQASEVVRAGMTAGALASGNTFTAAVVRIGAAKRK